MHSCQVLDRDLNAGLLIPEAEPGGWSAWLEAGPRPRGGRLRFAAAPFPCIYKQAVSLGEVRARGILSGPASSPESKTEGVPLQASAARRQNGTCTWNVDSEAWGSLGRLPGHHKHSIWISVLKSFDCLSTLKPGHLPAAFCL